MLKKIIFILFLLPICLVSLVSYRYFQIINQPIESKPQQFLIIERGTSSKQLATLLSQQHIVKKSFLLPYIIRFDPKFKDFKAGVFSLDKVTTLGQLLEQITGYQQVQLSLRFISGKTFKDWLETIKQASFLKQTLKGKSEEEIAKLLGIPHSKLEGWFAPNTYNYIPYSTDLALLQRLYKRQKTILDNAWNNRDENLPLKSAYEMLILASIIDKETAKAEERPQIASVFVNRLRLKMRLQTDPTVIYGMGDKYKGNITKRDLRKPTAYNTYVIEGLPPTPVAMPSEAAINAVAHPDTTTYLYFVADGTGGHKFSRTLKEHNQAVQEYLKWLRSKKGN
ncbi:MULTISPECIES: endolytic transglycosylase MltG [Pasteurellaceae]|uniref:Endolytic murein transglycosylase n=1 Tax=Pasteurella atlantica TaxID=2827233 RepID=A0AAW8CIW7_9PAST|nr:endolytic transglycosylase MltG [Pasteurella atlantica]MBR0574053.1 endolytic transglycosylase MltG [Pasteurella atlantica]MDP8040015.1 endolytic transglycosylase MltG [Pasteurella atlantica]MDP8042129.1 endolytic transglycosylase MltG [Pasteurella atlantica]MDP8044235.1 endolytic transglycosylase MltG [Pasteurella atlantica]MDP8046328.1 endolytic transglycosylase MltG [Pasteurella atlantica]